MALWPQPFTCRSLRVGLRLTNLHNCRSEDHECGRFFVPCEQMAKQVAHPHKAWPRAGAIKRYTELASIPQLQACGTHYHVFLRHQCQLAPLHVANVQHPMQENIPVSSV